MLGQKPEVKEGKIKWFGGYNSRTQQENGYGFIEDPELGDIFVHKNQVAEQDLGYLRENLIVTYKHKRDSDTKKCSAIEVQAKRVICFNPIKPRSICECLIEARNGREVFVEPRELNPNRVDDLQKIVNFTNTLDLEKLLKVVDYLISCKSESYISRLLESFFISNQLVKRKGEIFLELVLLNPYILKFLPDRIPQLEEKMIFKLLQDPGIKKLENKIICQLLDIFLCTESNSRKLEELDILIFPHLVAYPNTWNYLSTAGLTKLFLLENSGLARDDKNRIFNIIVQKIEDDANADHTEAWKNIELLRKTVEYHGYLWNIAPNSVKIEVIRDRFSEFLQLIEDWKRYKPQHLSTVEISCSEAYKFTEDDKVLTSSWAGSRQNLQSKFVKSTMYSARGAEKAVTLHYQKRGAHVSDVSIHQTTQLSEEWKFYDLVIQHENKKKFLDVKNARCSSSNKNRFSEFCIPRFKDRHNNEIIIAGVLSPYIADLLEDYISHAKKIVILGETQHSTLQDLQSRCSKLYQELEITTRRTKNLGNSQHLSEYLPPWLFDFDDEFYRNRHQIEERYRNLDDESIPPLFELNLLGLNPLSLALCAKREFPNHWKIELEPAIIRFSQILGSIIDDDPHLTLAHLFLAILVHFLENCLNPAPNFSPAIYKKLVFTDSPMTIGICDPISVIADMCKVLERIWDTCAEQLTSFSYFKFDSRGLLQGYNKKTKSFDTIIAYCGGWKEVKQGTKAPCGNEPLYIGFHRICPKCSKLICDKCDFCSNGCERTVMVEEVIESSANYFDRSSSKTQYASEDFFF